MGLAAMLVVALNPTDPFTLHVKVGLVAGLFAASPFVFYQLWSFIAPACLAMRSATFALLGL
jgi:Sec-independent protein secretion pathway component TatC